MFNLKVIKEIIFSDYFTFFCVVKKQQQPISAGLNLKYDNHVYNKQNF